MLSPRNFQLLKILRQSHRKIKSSTLIIVSSCWEWNHPDFFAKFSADLVSIFLQSYKLKKQTGPAFFTPP